MRRTVVLAAALVAAANVALPAPSAHAAGPAKKVAYFNDPKGGNDLDPKTTAPSALTTRIVSLIDEAVYPAVIRIALYFIGDDTTSVETEANQIKAAIDRARSEGIVVRIIVDDAFRAKESLPDDIENLDGNPDGGLVEVEFCTSGCYTSSSEGGKMHDKFMLIDHMGWVTGAENVVMVSSANWSDKQLLRHYHNDMVVTWGDTGLYNGMRTYWDRLWECAGNEAMCNDAGRPSPEDASGSTDTFVHFFPQPLGDDPQLSEINNVGCSGNKRIAVAMGSWSGWFTRGEWIVNALAERKRAGCVVQVLIPEDEPAEGVLRAYGVPFRCMGDGKLDDSDDQIGPGLHNKQILVDATYSGVSGSKIVFTGSTNFTDNALHSNDEVWLKIEYTPGGRAENLDVYDAYRARFDHIWTWQSFAC